MTVKPGALRFNTDSMKLEIFRGDSRGEYVGFGTIGAGQWEEIQVTSPELLTGGTRVLFGGGYTPSATKTIDFANIETTGNFTDFGDLTDTHNESKGSAASRTRAVWVGGGDEPNVETTSGERVQIASTGNSTQFSNALSVARRSVAGVCNGTRAIFAGGREPAEQNVIDYMEISALTASVDFGDISRSDTVSMGSVQSQTRGLFAGGYTPNVNSIDMITMSTLGNSADFGDLLFTPGQTGGASNAVRGIFTGDTSINYVTIATLGNGIDFGDISNSQDYCSDAASPTRVVFASGRAHPNVDTTVEYVTIATTGNPQDFGDLTQGRLMRNGACSNGHGGL
tara:strand:+ start:14 stop:1033 length:1020 start_codon:yes stop_codon:yes gene_type:complete